MDERVRLAIYVAAAALLLGMLADALLRVTPWGLNAALWFTLLISSVALLAGRRVAPLMGGGRHMALPALFFGTCFAWRDSLTLKTMDACAVVICLGLMAHRGHAGRLAVGGTLDYLLGIMRAGRESLAGAFVLVRREIGWERIPRGRWSEPLVAALRGLLIAVPILLVFGWLLTSADAVFARYVTDLSRLDVEDGATHVAVALACAWAVAGYLHGLLMKDRQEVVEEKSDGEKNGLIRIGAVEVLTALTLLDLLFLAFVTIQVRYLFGGHELVNARAGLTYAQYARRGFFELVWAVALALPLMLVAHTSIEPARKAVRRAFSAFSALLVALLLVVLASAAQRMRLYQSEYGLTELRFYTSAFMAWLALVLVWFCVTVLRGRRDRFAFGGLIGAMAGITVLHAINPDAMIVQTNIARAVEGRPFDVHQLMSLSDDAIPTLIQRIPELPALVREELQRPLIQRFDRKRWKPDWRAWSLARSRAMEAVLTTQEGASQEGG